MGLGGVPGMWLDPKLTVLTVLNLRTESNKYGKLRYF